MSLALAPYSTEYDATFNFTPAIEIADTYNSRLRASATDIARMRVIQAVMNNKMDVPLPELQQDERPAVANLAQQGMNQLARRIASVRANNYFPASDPSDPEEEERARNKHRIMEGWHFDNHINLLDAKRARQFLAYAVAPIVLKPSHPGKEPIPRWYTRDPLNTFPAECEFNDCIPLDCIFVQHHTLRWLLACYPDAYANLYKGFNFSPEEPYLDTIIDCIEYISPKESQLIALGVHDEAADDYTTPDMMAQRLSASVNLTEQSLAIVPGSINLDKQLGHFDAIIGMYQAQAALMALALVAQRRAVWPREWAQSNTGEQVDIPQIPDPYTGTPGRINGGQIVTQKLDPSGQALQLADLLSENQRMTAGLPSDFGGMSPTNVRTGARAKQLIATTIDFTINEAQDVFAMSRYAENRVAIAIDKHYYPKRKVYYMATRSFTGKITYSPSKLWDTDKHVVDFPIAGVDLQNLPIEGGQRVQMQTMSRKRFMEIDPAIPDAEAEYDQIVVEAIDTAMLSQVQTLAATPEGPFQPTDISRLRRLVKQGMDLSDAYDQVQREAQQRQAQQTEDLAAQQPGLSPPGQGVEQPPVAPQGQRGMAEFTQLLNQLGTSQTAMRYRA